jgi:hypothetical protein
MTLTVRTPRMQQLAWLLTYHPVDAQFAEGLECLVGADTRLAISVAKTVVKATDHAITVQFRSDYGGPGFWHIDSDAGDIELQVSRPQLTELGSWSATASIEGAPFVDADPYPTRPDERRFQWLAAAGFAESEIVLRFDGGLVGYAGWLQSTQLSGHVSAAFWYVGDVLLLLIGLVMALQAWRAEARAPAKRRRAEARATAKRLAVLLVAALLVPTTRELLAYPLFAHQRLLLVLAWVPLYLAASIFFNGRRLHAWAAAVGLSALAVGPAALGEAVGGRWRDTVTDDGLVALKIAAVVLAPVGVATLTYVALAATVLALASVSPLRDRVHERGRVVRWALVVVAVTTAVEWTRAVWRVGEIRELVELGDPRAIAASETFVEKGLPVTSYESVPTGFILYSLLPLIAAIGLIWLAAVRSSRRGIFVKSNHVGSAVVVVFAGLVVGTTDYMLGLTLPLTFLLALLLLRRVALSDRVVAAEDAFKRLNVNRRPRPLIVGRRAELLERAIQLEAERRAMADLYRSYVEKPDPDTYRRGRLDLSARLAKLATGESLVWRGKPATQVPREWTPSRVAVTTGPGASWWFNGIVAVELAVPLVLAQLLIWLYLRIDSPGPLFARQSLDVIWLVTGLVRETGFWVATAFVLGSLYPHLRGPNGVTKALTLGAVYVTGLVVGAVIESAQGLEQRPILIFRTGQLLLFTVALGVLIDRKSLRRVRLHWRHLLDLYRLRTIRVAAAYALPLGVTLVAMAQQILSGDLGSAFNEFIKSLSGLSR